MYQRHRTRKVKEDDGRALARRDWLEEFVGMALLTRDESRRHRYDREY
jgi:hypothetical protein